MAALECQGVNLRSQVLFWKHSGPQDVSRIGPLEGLVEPKREEGEPFRCGGAPWNRPGRDLAPKTIQGCIFIDLGSFLVDFGRISDQFGIRRTPLG